MIWSRPLRHWLAHNGIYLILVLGFVLRLALVLQAQQLPVRWDEVAYVQRAELLQQDPLGYDDLLRPPVYPIFLAATFQLLGETRFPAGVVQALLSTLLVAVMSAFTWELFRRRDVALVAAFITAIYPELITLARLYLSETLFMLLSVLGFLLLFRAWRSKRSWLYLPAGILLALAALTRELLAYFSLTVLPLWVILANGSRWRRSVPQVAVLAIGLALVFLPWVVRNYNLQERIVLSTSHSEIDLLRDNLRIAIRADPPATASKISMGKQVRNVLLQQDPDHRTLYVLGAAFGVIAKYPIPWIEDKFSRIQVLWRPFALQARVVRLGTVQPPWRDLLQSWLGWSAVALVLLGTLGLFTAKDDAPKLLIVFYILYSIVLFLMTHYLSRFRLPLLILLVPYAALAFLQIVAWLRAPTIQVLMRHRARTAAAGVVLLLFGILVLGLS